MAAMIFLPGTFTDLCIKSAVGTIGRVGANLERAVKTWGIGQEGLTFSEILHMGAIKIAPLNPSGVLRWINTEMAPPIDSPYRNLGRFLNWGFWVKGKASIPILGKENWGCLKSPTDVIPIPVDHKDDATWQAGGGNIVAELEEADSPEVLPWRRTRLLFVASWKMRRVTTFFYS
nr:hypothetical protein PRUPE_8G121800 [Ipomoea batatas]